MTKINPLPASLQTQLAMYDSTIRDAEMKRREAETARIAMLDTFHGFKGKIIRVTRRYHRSGTTVRHFTVSHVGYYNDGMVSTLRGPAIKADGTPSRMNYSLYGHEIDSADWRVVDSVDAV